jgi:hypothetical protein
LFADRSRHSWCPIHVELLRFPALVFTRIFIAAAAFLAGLLCGRLGGIGRWRRPVFGLRPRGWRWRWRRCRCCCALMGFGGLG